MSVGAVTCLGMAVFALIAGQTAWPLVGLTVLLGTFFAWGALTRFHTIVIHERGLVWRHGREQRLMPFEQVVDYRISDNGVIVDGGDELFIANTLSYSEVQRQRLAEALRSAVPDREKIETGAVA